MPKREEKRNLETYDFLVRKENRSVNSYIHLQEDKGHLHELKS